MVVLITQQALKQVPIVLILIHSAKLSTILLYLLHKLKKLMIYTIST